MKSNHQKSGIRVLIVDDNATNLELAKRCFERLGCKADVAVDGLQAIHAMQNAPYDIVFMDCQMPNLDGFQTSKHIREFPNQLKCKDGIPIVALTASATDEVREACLTVGMNDYITKPFTLDQLRNALSRWLPDRFQFERNNDAAVQEDTALSGYVQETSIVNGIDKRALNALRILDTTSNPHGFVNLVSTFLASSRTIIDQLREAFDSGNVVSIAQAAHSLRSSSANLGAIGLSKLCHELETTVGPNNLTEVGSLIGAISDKFDKACSILAMEVTKSQGAALNRAPRPDSPVDSDAEVILLVDDDTTQRAIARGYLEQAGFRVEEATDGLQGLDLARQLQPNLILLDVVMPKLNGFEVCRQIRDDKNLTHTPILMSTGLDNIAALDRIFEAGATDSLAKPTTWKMLQYRVKFLLRRHRIEQELRDAKSKAEAADLAKTHFLANMSHELRTPLNAILGFSEVIKDQHFGPDGAAQYQDYAKNIHESGGHLLGIIDDVLDMSRAASGNLELADEAVDLNEAIDAAIMQIGPFANKENVSVCNDIQVPLPEIRGDLLRLVQIFLNLLSNAVKFTPDGGSVRVLADRHEANWISISVTDSGIGIAEGRIAEIFQPFKQLEGVFNKKHEGTGLGIPIAAELAQLHGGHIEYKSALGIGTTATLTLPISNTNVVENDVNDLKSA
jgi:signal transduction histidine kinase